MADIINEELPENEEVALASRFVNEHLLKPCGSDPAQQIGTRMTYVESAMQLYAATNDPAAKKVYLDALRLIPVIMQT